MSEPWFKEPASVELEVLGPGRDEIRAAAMKRLAAFFGHKEFRVTEERYSQASFSNQPWQGNFTAVERGL
jgi:hypothetical protein